MGIETKKIQVELPNVADGPQIIIERDGSSGRWKIKHDRNPQLPDGFSYASGGAYAGVIDTKTGLTTFWQLQGDQLKILPDDDKSVKGLLRQLRRGPLVERPQSSPPKPAIPPVTNQTSRSPRLPKNLDLQISHEDFVAGLNDISDQGGNTFINLKSADGSITLKLHVSRNASGDLSLSQTARFEMEGESIDAEVAPLPARDGGYRITAQGKTFYFYAGRDAGEYWVNPGYPHLLGPNPQSGEELRIAHAITRTRGDTGSIKKLLQIEINKRPLPNGLVLTGKQTVHEFRNKKFFPLANSEGLKMEFPAKMDIDESGATKLITFEKNCREVTIQGPQGFKRELVVGYDIVHGRSYVDLGGGRKAYLEVGITKHIHDAQRVITMHLREGSVSQEGPRHFIRGLDYAQILNLGENESGSTPLDYDAHITQARAHGFTPSSPKAFCTYANLGVATLAGMGVEWFFSSDEENGEHHTRAEVGFWRQVATALATGYTSTLFSNGRISMDQALKSYTKGLLTGLPIDFGFNAAGFGSSPFAFAASFLANHFGDKIVEAVIGNNRLRSGLATTAGLALFLGSTMVSYYNETRQNKPNPLA